MDTNNFSVAVNRQEMQTNLLHSLDKLFLVLCYLLYEDI